MKAKRGVLLLAMLAVLLFGGCAVGEASIPTPLPPQFIPTAVALTAQVLKAANAPTATTLPPLTPTPTARPSPTATKSNSSAEPIATVVLPTVTPTPQANTHTAGAGYAPVQILYPGADSRVLSPLKTRFAVRGRYTDEIHVELIGEDGRLIYRKVMRLGKEQPAHALLFFNLEIPFELEAKAEVGRLQISAWDSKHHPLFQNAVPLILLQEGQQQINYRPADRSPIVFIQPLPNQTVKSDAIMVIGRALPVSQAVEVLLMNSAGKILLYKTIALKNLAADGYAQFALRLQYPAKKPFWARIIVREYAQKPEGMVYLNSRTVRISP